MTSRNHPLCQKCRTQAREGRSLLCPDCRAAHRRDRKAETQRARRAAARQDPHIQALLDEVHQVSTRLGAYLSRQQAKADAQGQPLSSVQQDAKVLVEKANALVALVAERGLRTHQDQPQE